MDMPTLYFIGAIFMPIAAITGLFIYRNSVIEGTSISTKGDKKVKGKKARPVKTSSKSKNKSSVNVDAIKWVIFYIVIPLIIALLIINLVDFS